MREKAVVVKKDRGPGGSGRDRKCEERRESSDGRLARRFCSRNWTKRQPRRESAWRHPEQPRVMPPVDLT